MSDPQPSSTTPESDRQPALPLDELTLTPQWMKSAAPSYQNFTERERGPRKRDGFDRRDRAPRPDRPPRERRPEGGAKPAPPKHRPPQRDRPPHATSAGKGQRPSRQPSSPQPFASPVELAFAPEDKAFASIIDTIKQSPRAYAFFDVAKLVLNRPERHVVRLQRMAGADGKRAPLFVVTGLEQVFLGRDEALRWLLRRHPGTIFEETKAEIDPPRGNFVFVNRCGLTGEILGPPNYHEYQSRLVRHHQARLAHMPFEKFRSQIQTSKDPEAVKAWVASMSVKTEYKCRLDAEPKTFASREELEKHVFLVHVDKLVAAAPDVTISGTASRKLEHGAILESVRLAWQDERRFPLKTANAMQARLRDRGLHFFKDDKAITYLSAIKLKRFDAGQVVTEHVRSIVEFLRAHPFSARKEFAAIVTPTLTEEQILSDLHWLIQDGYVVELFNNKLWIPDERAPKSATAPAPVQPPQPTSAPELAAAADAPPPSPS